MVMKNKEKKRSDGRRSGKEVVAEEESNKTIDVNDEASDDDFVDSRFGSGVRRSGRNQKSSVCQSEKPTSVIAGSKGKIELKGTKRQMETGDNSGGGKKQKKSKTKPVQKCVYNTSLTLHTRSSPKTLCNTLEYLKPNQKACLEEIGFGGMIDFRVDGIPGRMGVYVVHKFDENTMEMKLETGSIEVTKEKIGELLGLKNEGVELLEGTPVKNSELIRVWSEQYEDLTDIKPADVKWMIRKSDKADMNFKLNFIVLFATLMGIITHRGGCDLSVLEYIKPDTNLANINWCDYIWRALKKCKESWTMGKKNSFFRGPLTLLTMMYVDGTKSASKIVCRTRPPTKVWTAEMLSDRENEDLKNGGFGNGELEDEYVDEESEPIPTDIEGCVWMLEKYVAGIKNARIGFDRIIEAANTMFPGNDKLVGLSVSYVNSLKYVAGVNELGIDGMVHSTTENINDAEEQHEGHDVGISVSGEKEQSPVSGNDVHGDSMLNIQTPDASKTLTPETFMSSGFDRPDTVVGVLTQQAFVHVAEEVDRSIEKSKSKSDNMEIVNHKVDRSIEKSTSKGWADMSSFSLNVSQDFELTPVINNNKAVLNPVPISACKPNSDVFIFRGRRVTHKSKFECSPYNDRVADMTKQLTSEEVKVYLLMFANGDHNDEILFKGESGQQSSRDQMQSLGPDNVENNVLDTWAEVRNYMEKFKNQDSPLRLFLPTFVLDEDIFSDQIRFSNLVKHVESVIGNSSAAMRLNKTDVVFLPVDNEGHRFLIVFDLKYGAVIVFDQKKHGKFVTRKTVKKGAKIPNRLVAEMLHADFGRYVQSMNHYKAAGMINAELEFGEFEWQTVTLRPYAGMILMRIMETYMGKGMPSWSLRLNTNRGMLDKELTVLTKKYAAIILLSDCNMLKDVFMAKLKKDGGIVPGVSLKKGNLKIKG